MSTERETSQGSGEALAKKLIHAAETDQRLSEAELREAAALLTEQQNDLEMAQEAAALWRTRLAEKLTEQSRQPLSARWQELFWALPLGPMRSKLRALEIDMGQALREQSRQQEAWQVERERLHRLLQGADAAIDPEDYPELSEAIFAEIGHCDGVCTAPPQPKDTP